MPDTHSTHHQSNAPEDCAPNNLRRISKLQVMLLFFATALAGEVSLIARIQTTHTQLDWGHFLGPFHIIALHFPLVLLVLVALFEVVWWQRGGKELRGIIYWLMLFSAVSMPVTVGMGLFLAQEGGYDEAPLEAHRFYGVIAMWTTVLAMLFMTWAIRRDNHAAQLGYRILLALTLILLIIIGHSGGTLSHGSQFLVKKAPDFIKRFIQEKQPDAEMPVEMPKTKEEIEQDVFMSQVWPILEQQCLSCHGPEKQKGEYRVDEEVVLFGGGETGEIAIEPGDPAASSLVRTILLPEEHEEVMPPEGKGQVTEEEAWIIISWIKDGAPFTRIPLGMPTDDMQ